MLRPLQDSARLSEDVRRDFDAIRETLFDENVADVVFDDAKADVEFMGDFFRQLIPVKPLTPRDPYINYNSKYEAGRCSPLPLIN